MTSILLIIAFAVIGGVVVLMMALLYLTDKSARRRHRTGDKLYWNTIKDEILKFYMCLRKNHALRALSTYFGFYGNDYFD